MTKNLGMAVGALVAAFSLLGSGAALAQDHGHGKHHGKHEGHGGDKASVEKHHASATLDVWVCESDPTTGLSFEGACPLDGKPAVKKTVERSTLTDLHNAKCPIMGGDTKGDTFAIYKGKMVHFCCAGCQGKFFEDPAGYVAKIEKAPAEDKAVHDHGM